MKSKSTTLTVAVAMGGLSAERDVSFRTGACVVAHLARRHRVKPVAVHPGGRWEVPEGFVGEGLPESPEGWFRGEPASLAAAIPRLLELPVDVVFNALHGPGGEDGSFQGLLRHLGLPFTGPDVIPAAVTMDKGLTKSVLAAAGVATPRTVPVRLDGPPERVEREVERLAARVPLPWVVKPNALGSSVGVEIVKEPGQLTSYLARREDPEEPWAAGLAGGLVVEEFVAGRELTCGVLETGPEAWALPPVELRPRNAGFFDYNSKYTPGATEEICPAPLVAREAEAVQRLALAVHQLFRCAPLSRTDMILREDGGLTVLEINTLPGMTATSLIPLSASRCGLSLADLFEGLIQHALARDASRAVPP